MSENEASKVNVPLLRKAVEWAEAEAAKPAIDSQWLQYSWLSDPSRKARTLAEAALEEIGDGCHDYAEVEKLAGVLEPQCGTAFCIAGYVGQMLDPRYAEQQHVEGVHVSEFAAEALGLDDAGSRLFLAQNTIADVRRIAEDLAGERL